MIDEKKLIETINEIPKVWNGKECLVNVNKVIKYINDQPKIEKWILCDKPPKNDNKVLIFNGKDYSVGYYDGKHWINSIHPVKWAPIEL